MKGFSLQSGLGLRLSLTHISMKNKYIVVILLIGIIWTILGAFFKIAHFEIGPITGTVMLAIGTFLEVMFLLIKVMSNKKDNFLNN